MGEVRETGVGAVRSGLPARRWSVPALLASSALLVGLLSGCKPTPESLVGTTSRVAVMPDGSPSPYGSGNGSSLSADGRYVAFMGRSELVPGATYSQWEVFVRDRVAGTTTRVAVASDGTQGDDESYFPTISRDGRYVAFMSGSTNLVPGDTNGFADIFVHDRSTGVTERVSVASDGTQANGSADYSMPSISDDGRYVLFTSQASNLVAGDANGGSDLFVRDRSTGVTTRVAVTVDGVPAAGGGRPGSLSGDGRLVTFTSSGSYWDPDTPENSSDVFVLDRATGETTIVSEATDGSPAGGSDGPRISGDGRYVIFTSSATDLVPGGTEGQNVFVRDLVTGVTSVVSVGLDGQAAGHSFDDAISDDGHYAVFLSQSTALVAGDDTTYPTGPTWQVYVRDLVNGVTARISAAPDGTPGDGLSAYPTISGNGLVVGFESEATNLVPDDTNGTRDVVVNDRTAAS